MSAHRGIIIAILVLALAVIFNGLCQRYEPTNAGKNGLCARFDKFLGQHQQKEASGRWENLAAMADGIPAR